MRAVRRYWIRGCRQAERLYRKTCILLYDRTQRYLVDEIQLTRGTGHGPQQASRKVSPCFPECLDRPTRNLGTFPGDFITIAAPCLVSMARTSAALRRTGDLELVADRINGCFSA